MALDLALQELGSPADQTLALAYVAGAQNGDGWFAPRHVARLFEARRLPAPRDVEYELARHELNGLAVRRLQSPTWSLTPIGRRSAERLIGVLGDLPVASEARPVIEPGQLLDDALPPAFAPTRWRSPLQRLLEGHPFDRNVFCMTRFPDHRRDDRYLDPVADVIPVARSVMREHGLELHLASDRQLDDDLFGNIAAHMWGCRYGIALVEDRLDRGINPNLLIELGAMQAIGRRCAVLKDATVLRLPTDFGGHLYKGLDFSAPESVAAALHRWVADDLRIGRCRMCPTRD